MEVILSDESYVGGKGRWAWITEIPCGRLDSLDATKWAEYWCDLNGIVPVGIMAGCGADKIGWAHVTIETTSFAYAE